LKNKEVLPYPYPENKIQFSPPVNGNQLNKNEERARSFVKKGSRPLKVLLLSHNLNLEGAPKMLFEISNRADVILVDPEAWWTVDTDSLLSEGKNSPFLGWELKGRVQRTLLAGRTLYERI